MSEIVALLQSIALDRKRRQLPNDPTTVSYTFAVAASSMDLFFSSQFHKTDREYITAGDEVVFSKAGKETYGLGSFFSSLQKRMIPGLSFFGFSLIDVQERQSYSIQAVQLI